MAEKYHEKSDEIADFIKNSSQLLADMNFLFQYGQWRLSYGMTQWKDVDHKPPFSSLGHTPPYPYVEKDYYVRSSSNLWYLTMWRFYPSLNEMYYNVLLAQVKAFEKTQNFTFNKGMIYANLGVAQSAQMKLDEGFANILKALIEDSPYSENTPEYNLRRRDLFTQFEILYVKTRLQTIISTLGIAVVPNPEQFVTTFLDSLNDDQRVFFNCTFARIFQNWDIWKDKENSFTAGRLLAYTQDFCLFNEDLLKSKMSQTELRSRRWKLAGLIAAKFPGIDVSSSSAAQMSDLDTKLPLELTRQNDQEKCLRILLMIRNYSSHNLEGGTTANYFYSHYSEILAELVRSTCYITLLPAPQ
ncbi:MAG: hypothetical protein ABSB28_08790 [Candidatus Bathyarchaeia archaeon]